MMLMVLMAGAVSLGAAVPPWEGAFFVAAPSEVLAAAREVPVPDNAEVDVLWREVEHRFDAQHRQVITSRLVYRLHTRGAVESWGSVQARHSPWHENKPRIRARVILKDGTVRKLDPATLTESSARPDDDKREIEFKEERITRGPLPAVAPDCIVEEGLCGRTNARCLITAW